MSATASATTPASSQSQLPAHASVVVIGGGVMGCSTLYHLTKLGISDAVLLERNELTSGTTWHSAAQVRALRSSRNMTDLIRYSIELYGRLEEETGQATGWINKGSLSIATTPERLVHVKRQESLAHLFDLRAQSVSREEAQEIWPLMNTEDVLGAVWSPDDGRVSPSDLCAALAKGAKSGGAKIFEKTGVLGILTDGGKVVGVETTRGTIRCDAVALCSGLWSREVGALAGAEVPLYPCEHFYLLTKPIDGISGNMPTLSDHDSHLYIRDDSGGLLVGCFEPLGKAIDPARLGDDFAFQLLPEDWDHFEPMMINALHRLPALETAEVKTLLNGPESFTPDGAFMLGETAETRGLFLGCGMNSVGVATGGGAGMALAHCILKGHTPMDLHEVDPKRFPAQFNSVAALADRVPEVLGKHYEITYPGRQWQRARNLRSGPLADRWSLEKAHLGQFYGWERPLYFNKTQEPVLTFGKPAWQEQVGREVAQAHEKAALFDQSTFGKIRVEGPAAESFLNRVCANDMTKAPGRVVYTALLNERGGFESDLTVLRLAEDSYRLYVGTTAIKRDLTWLTRHRQADEAVTFTDETEAYGVLGLMGPLSGEVAAKAGLTGLSDLGYFRHRTLTWEGIELEAVRLSYVGEAGWEITCPSSEIPKLYDAFYAAGARPVGLFAQSSMRIEKGYLAYGHDLDTDVTPLAAGLDFALAWTSDFIGKDALLAQRDQPLKDRMMTLVLDDPEAVPLGHEPVYLDDRIIGQTTSAAFGYRIGKPVALAYLSGDVLTGMGDKNGTLAVEVDIAGQRFSAQAQQQPAYDPKGQRMKNTG
ncbi:GcvT family protein [Rhodovibrionaceae bacterium A322]